VRLLKAFVAFLIIGLLVHQAVGAEREPLVPMGRVGARMSGLGGAAVALPGTVESLLSNPATLVYVGWPELTAGLGNQDLGDIRQCYFFGAIPVVGQLVTALGMVKLHYPGGELADFDTYLFSFAFPLSHNGKLMTGVNAKFLRQEIVGQSELATGGGIDLGLFYDVFASPTGMGLQLGIALADAQTVMKTQDQEITLPNLFRFGATFHLSAQRLITIAFENQNSPTSEFASFQVLRAGFEQTIQLGENYALSSRFGYLQRLDHSGLMSFGFGSTIGDWQIDYAFQIPFTLTDAYHQLSISWGYQRLVKKESKQPVVTTPAETVTTGEEKKEAEDIFAALETAAELEEDFTLFKEEKPKPTPTPIPQANLTDEEEEEEEVYAYNLAVPDGPAAGENASLGVVPEMPGFFSGQFSAHQAVEGISIARQDLRLHVVVNPFSPNGDGRHDRTIFVGRLVSEKLRVSRWILTISKAGKVIKFFRGGSRLPRNLEWDGKDRRGRVLPDGSYTAVLRIMDEHGMELAAASQTVVIRTRAQAIRFKGPGTRVLTGKRRERSLSFTFPDIPGSSDWRFSIISPLGKRIYQKRGNGRVPAKINWRPQRRGRTVPAGKYTARLTFRDEVGLKTKAEVNFRIKYAAFSAALQADPELFQPKARNGKGVTFQPQVSGKVQVKEWRLAIHDEREKTVKIFKGKGRPPKTIFWNGKLDGGKVAKAGSIYRGVLTVTTTLGTQATAKSAQLQCDVGAYTGKKALSINLVRVQFQPASSDLSAKAQQALIAAAKTLSMYKTDYHLEINGYCDRQETKGSTVELSRARARAVVDFLADKARVPRERMQAVGRGTSRLLAQGSSDSDRAKNRRVEIVLYAK